MSPEQLKAQRIMILQTASANLGVIIDQIESTDPDLATKTIEEDLQTTRIEIDDLVKELQNG